MKSKLSLSCLLAMTFAGACPSVLAEKTSRDFANRVQADGLSLGARLLTEDEVKNRFLTEVHRQFLVVEIAMEPVGGAAAALRTQFALRRVGSDLASPPVTPADAAEALRAAAESDKAVTVTPSAEVGYRKGDPRPPYDRKPLPNPILDNQKGPYTRGAVDVTWGEAGAGAGQADRRAMETELSDKETPLGVIREPVHGYVYFPKPDDQTAEFQLEFDAPSGKVALSLKP